MADFAFGTAGEERLRKCFPKFTTSGGRGQQVAAGSVQELAAEGEFFLPEAIGEETKIADALKAGWQGMQ